MKHRMRLSLLCASLLGWAGLVAADPPPAPGDTRYAIDIPAQDLGNALQAFALASHHKLLYSSDLVAGKTSTAIKGRFTTEEGVRRILANTSLKYEVTTNGLVMIRAASVADPPGDLSQSSNTGQATKEGKKDSSDGFLAAQAAPGQTSGDVSVEKQDEQTSEKKKREQQLQEVVVTGSRIPTTAGNEVQPLRSYTREVIEISGQTSLGEFLNTLPDVSYFISNGPYGPGVQTVQLHGLPVGTTATLLDGRRLQNSSLGFFDLSSIPLAAIERIEVLPVGDSAVYGADALAGAVNTILRKNFSGFEANTTLDYASGVNNPSVNLAWGKSFSRGSVMLVGSYQQLGELSGAEREPWSSTSIPAGIPASIATVALFDDVCAPGNVYSVDGSNLPGLSSPAAGIPAGTTGKPTIGQFAATAGKLNVCNSSRWSDITPQTQREGALLSAHYWVTDSMDLFAEVLFSHQHVRNYIGPQLQAFASVDGTVAANNPYNPFGVPVNVSFAYPGPGAYPGAGGVLELLSTYFFRPMIGVQGSLLSDWHYEVTAFYSRDRNRDNEPSSGSSTSYQGIIDALSSPNPDTALNPFASGAPGTAQLLSSLEGPAFGQDLVDHMVNGQGILRGPVLELPAGAVQAVIGGEYSQEKQRNTQYYAGAPPPIVLQRTSYAVFTETQIPLLADRSAAKNQARLALTVAGRYDHSDDYGGKATWQSALLWHATDTLAFRGGYGLSYQAPQLFQISGPQVSGPTPLFIPDPFRGNQPIDYPVNLVSGPNFNLKPETGDALNLGVEYSSQALPGLHTSLTWYDLKITNFISAEGAQTLVDFPALFPGAVIRAPPTPADLQQGFLGMITQVNDTYYNFGNLQVAGFDADISYTADTRMGQFTPSLSIANVYKWVSSILPGAPSIETVNVATSASVGGGTPGWSPRWKGTAALAWREGPLSMTFAGRYIGPYLDYQYLVANNHEIGNSWIFDFNARYELGKRWASPGSWLAGSYVALGAVNLFNKTPPFSYNAAWYDYQEYDIRGRYLVLNVGVRF